MSNEKSSRNWRLRVIDIIESIGKIKSYTTGMSLEQFQSDIKTVDAAIRNFEVIGEAAGYIPEEVQAAFPDLAWLEMRGMGNIIIHEYFRVSLPIIWQTITHDLESLAAGMNRILKQYE